MEKSPEKSLEEFLKKVQEKGVLEEVSEGI